MVAGEITLTYFRSRTSSRRSSSSTPALCCCCNSNPGPARDYVHKVLNFRLVPLLYALNFAFKHLIASLNYNAARLNALGLLSLEPFARTCPTQWASFFAPASKISGHDPNTPLTFSLPRQGLRPRAQYRQTYSPHRLRSATSSRSP